MPFSKHNILIHYTILYIILIITYSNHNFGMHFVQLLLLENTKFEILLSVFFYKDAILAYCGLY